MTFKLGLNLNISIKTYCYFKDMYFLAMLIIQDEIRSRGASTNQANNFFLNFM